MAYGVTSLPGARRRRDVHHREHVLADGMAENIRRPPDGKHGDCLRRVHRRTAADRDDKISAERTRERRPLAHTLYGRVVRHLVEHRILLPVCIQSGRYIRQRTVLIRTFARYDERAFAERAEKAARFLPRNLCRRRCAWAYKS